MLARKGVTCVDAHTSVPAPLPGQRLMADKTRSRVIIPVHTEKLKDYARYFRNVKCLKDGESWLVQTKAKIIWYRQRI